MTEAAAATLPEVTLPEVTLYDYWRSSACYRVRLALNLKGIAYRAVPLDLLEGRHRAPDHLARHPQGLVPVLEIDGLRLTQSLAILEYLDETRPDTALLPKGAPERARARALAQAIAMEIHPLCNLSVVAHVADLAGGGEETRTAWMRRYIGRGLGAVETMLKAGPPAAFCHGDRPGYGDCCLIPQLYNARRWGLDLRPYPGLLAVESACAEREAFTAAHPDAAHPDQREARSTE